MHPRLAALLLAALLAGGARAAAPGEDVLAQIDRLVQRHFYSGEVLERTGWRAHVEETRAALARARTREEREALLAKLVRGLGASHTDYLPPTRPEYWGLASIFDDAFAEVPMLCRAKRRPPHPVAVESVGVLWREVEGAWFVGGVYGGGPAARAGLRLGDEVVQADGRPFGPVTSFTGKAGRAVTLGVRRVKGGPLERVQVTPARVRPSAELQEALSASARVLEAGGKKVGYVHVWSWAGSQMQDALRSAIVQLNPQGLQAFVLDLRGGWGGASPEYLSVFDRSVPALVSVDRDGTRHAYDPVVRVPAVVLIDRGSRSGKESIAYGVKKHRLATLVGANTAGAVLAGSPFCLDDGALLFLARSAVTLDGEVLEGKGVAPDVEVPFDVRWAQGRDPQLARALELLARP